MRVDESGAGQPLTGFDGPGLVRLGRRGDCGEEKGAIPAAHVQNTHFGLEVKKHEHGIQIIEYEHKECELDNGKDRKELRAEKNYGVYKRKERRATKKLKRVTKKVKKDFQVAENKSGAEQDSNTLSLRCRSSRDFLLEKEHLKRAFECSLF